VPPKKKSAGVRRERPTIREVAKLAGVGLMTVSRVINDHPSVKPRTKKKVFAAIQALGYERNEAAGLLKGQRAMMVGLIVPDLSDVFFAICANTIERLAREHGYQTLIVSSGHDADLEIQQAELMGRRKLSGLLLVTSGKTGPERLEKLMAGGLPIVAFDRPLEGVSADAVLIENRAGAEEAIEHLVRQRHSRIACLGYDDSAYPVRERVRGYRNVMLANGFQPNLALNIDSLDAARSWLETELKKTSRSTAIFSTNYRTTVFVLRALVEKKVKIPAEMAFVGFDDFDLAPAIAPPVTTVGQSPVDLAKRAFRLLIDRINNLADGVAPAPEKIMLPASLIIRESCGSRAKH